MGFAGVELAALAGADNLHSIRDRGGPIEPLSKRVAYEGTWCRMMATYSSVDVADQLPAFRDGDAAL